jgi:hypothetical protein
LDLLRVECQAAAGQPKSVEMTTAHQFGQHCDNSGILHRDLRDRIATQRQARREFATPEKSTSTSVRMECSPFWAPANPTL